MAFSPPAGLRTSFAADFQNSQSKSNPNLSALFSLRPLAQQHRHDSVAMEPSVTSSSLSSSVSSAFTAATNASLSTSASAASFSASRMSGFDRAIEARISPARHSRFSTPAAAPNGIKKALDISNLMSPPEADRLDSFSVGDATLSYSRNTSPESHQHRFADGHSSSSSTLTTSLASSPVATFKTADKAACPPQNGPLSPPISPKDKKPEPSVVQGGRDPILYPASNDSTATLVPPAPLFAAASAIATITAASHAPSAEQSQVVYGHVAARSPQLFSRASPPRGEDYELALYLKSEVMKRYDMDRSGWLKKERDQLVADRAAAANRNKRLHLLPPPAKPPLQTMRPTVPRTTRPLQPQLQPQSEALRASQSSQSQMLQPSQVAQLPQLSQPSALHAVSGANSRVNKRSARAGLPSRAVLPARIAPHVTGAARESGGGRSNGTGGSAGGFGSGIRIPNSSPEPRIRTTAPNREDKDFMALADYCPPLSTLPGRTNNLRVDWKGNALDLSKDVHRNLLHPDEIGLAASLRLDCATYLTSKRRIFIRRLECARIHKEFRKTDAQQACKIDVNKASKLWMAYEKVGWLHLDHMKPYL